MAGEAKKRGSLKTVLVGVVMASVILSSAIVSVFSIINTVNTNNTQVEVYRSRLVDDVKLKLKHETEEAMSICAVMYGRYQNGEMTLAEAEKESADIIRELRYDDGNGYFWVDTSKVST